MIKFKKKKLLILITTAFLAFFGFLSRVEAEYYDSGTLISENVLSGQYVNSIDYFGYDATVSASTTLKVQFSQNKTNWYDSSGTEDAWDTLSDGDHLATGDAIDLSSLNWDQPYFFYKVSLETTDSSSTPTLKEIRVHFDEGTAPSTSYLESGTLTSNNLLDGEEIEGTIIEFSYNASSVPSGATLKVQFSQDGSSWYNSSGDADGWDTCSEGEHTIKLTELGWSTPNFYYKMEFTSDGSDTPVLNEISLKASLITFKIKKGLKFKKGMKFK